MGSGASQVKYKSPEINNYSRSREAIPTSLDVHFTSQDTPTTSQEAPITSQDAPSISKEAPPTSQEAPFLSQEAPPTSQAAPPTSQEAPPKSQEAPPKSQEAPPRGQEAPPPSPSNTRKEDIYKTEDYAFVDEHVKKMPPELNYGNFEDLIAYLISNEDWNDVAKIRAIFTWIASVDIYNLRGPWPKDGSPMECFYKLGNKLHRFFFGYSYTDLLEHMCKLASIPSMKLKGEKRYSGETFGDGCWNAVYIAGSWRLIDPEFAFCGNIGGNSGKWVEVESDGKRINDKEGEASAGTEVHRVDEFYFLTDPDKFIWNHLPIQTEWQLLKKPVTQEQFKNRYFVGEMFYELGMTNTPETKLNYIVQTKHGETHLTFGLPESRSFTYRFSYTFLREQSVQRDKINAVLGSFVINEHREDLLRYSLRFPISGTFKLEIYGQYNGVKMFCCCYVIKCLHAKKSCLPLPDCPKVGWGPGPATKAAGLKPLTHKEAKVVTKDGCTEIRLSKERALSLHQMLKHYFLDEANLSKYSVTELDGDEVVVYLRLPQKGEYALKLFAQGLDEKGTAPNVMNYLINCDQVETHSDRFPNVTTGMLGRNETNSTAFGVRALSHSGGKLNIEQGKLTLVFEVNLDMIELVCEMHTLVSEAASQMAEVITNDGNMWKFDLDIPVNGEYAFNIFARRKDDPAQVFHVHTYLIISFGRGSGAIADSKVTAINTSVPTTTLETSDYEMTVPVPPGVSRATAAIHKRNGNEAPGLSTIRFLYENEKIQFKVQIFNYGKYMVNVYSVDDTGNQLNNVYRYQINRMLPSRFNKKRMRNDSKPPDMSEDFRKHHRKILRKAMKSNDPRNLKQAGGEELDPLVKKARQQLNIFKARTALAKAYRQRNKDALDQAIAYACKVNWKQELDKDIDRAVRLRLHLIEIKKLRHAVREMEGKTISEIKSYSNPPDGVHQCLMATFLLLGHPLNEVKEWHQIQVLLGKTGQESLMRKVSNFDAKTVPLKTATIAKNTLSPYSKGQIRDVSAGAATFYIWAVGMIADVESYQELDDTHDVEESD